MSERNEQRAEVVWSREIELPKGVTLSLSPVMDPFKPWTGHMIYELRITSTALEFVEAHENRNRVCNLIIDALTRNPRSCPTASGSTRTRSTRSWRS